MDGVNNNADRVSSLGSSLRRRSLSILSIPSIELDDDVESEIVSQAGDIGDQTLCSKRYSESSSLRFSFENLENGAVTIQPDVLLLGSHENKSPLCTVETVHSVDKNQGDNRRLPQSLEYISYLVHLAVFGILGVLTRYLLQKLFGPAVADVTSYEYTDLPSNMVGSFLMGWLGVIFKADIASVSDHLAIGLTTGYLGSLTTFSGWNQKLLDISTKGEWVSAVAGYLLGLFLTAYSIIFGIQTAKGLKWILKRKNLSLRKSVHCSGDSYKQQLVVLVVLGIILCLLWCISGVLAKREFNRGSGVGAQLWLACIVGPFGVWIRWFLARFNGRGLGQAGLLKWVPFGTLIANIGAAVIMASLSTVMKVVNTKTCDNVATSIQFGLLGCLSTVSTFIAEFNAMTLSKYPWRAYAYALFTFIVSFGLGTLIYSVPVWIKGYD